MKIIAFYLPQFHEIPENNEWWGEHFTEWTNVRAAKPLYPGHSQPKLPYHNNFYCLLDKEVMAWQAGLAKKAGIYGFCFYHYWFKGKQLLEKPVDHYLQWKDINQKYCLSWANESWKRTWSKAEGNDWNELADKTSNKTGPSMLMKQDYGTKEDWAKHFEYLLPFFLDSRYIYIDNKPVFLIYKPDKIPCLNAMITHWNELARKNGLDGVYVIGTNSKKEKHNKLDAMVMYEPAYTFANDMPYRYLLKEKVRLYLQKYNIHLLKTYHYNTIWKRMINRKVAVHKNTVYAGAFVNFDDTPRRGINGTMFRGVTPTLFSKYMKALIKKSKKELHKDYIFLTAWNEWAEGAYMEPDDQNKYEFLAALRRAQK